MTAPKTTIVLILMAGDSGTTNQIDALLWEFQEGMNNWSDGDPPEVICFYYRMIEIRHRIETYRFHLQSKTLSFLPTEMLDEKVYPPTNPSAFAKELHGPINIQIENFLKYVNSRLPNEGPIRLVIGAHGYFSVGINPWLRWLTFRWLFGGLIDKILRYFLPSSRRLIVPLDLVSTKSPPGGIALDSRHSHRKNPPSLYFDDLSKAFHELPRMRLKTLVLHTCVLSCIEAIVAFRLFPHQIACETLLYDVMPFQVWFSTFADPMATASEVTDGCFNSLTASAKAGEIFSSLATPCIDDLLDGIDELGTLLNHQLSHNRQPTIAIIKAAYIQSQLNSYQVDIAQFCISLKSSLPGSAVLLDSIVAALRLHQLHSPVKTGSFSSPRYVPFQGVSIFLPESGAKQFAARDLPKSFLGRVRQWHVFLEHWQTIT